MTTGTVRWFDVSKGYGLIKPDDGGVDVLVDIGAVECAETASLKQGQRLSFEIVHDERIGRSYAENLIASEILTPPLTAFSPITPLHDRRAIPASGPDCEDTRANAVRDRAVGYRDIQSDMTLRSYCARLAI
jgi:cold shock protein